MPENKNQLINERDVLEFKSGILLKDLMMAEDGVIKLDPLQRTFMRKQHHHMRDYLGILNKRIELFQE